MSRTGWGGLGLSAIRRSELVFAIGAVTSVPTGKRFEAVIPEDLIAKGRACFKKRDPEFEFQELPVEFRVGRERRITYRGRFRLGGYEVWVLHGFFPGLPSIEEGAAIVQIGGCSSTAANASLELLCADGIDWNGPYLTQKPY
jgi:hypothetical protein